MVQLTPTIFLLLALGLNSLQSNAQPELESWLINTDGATGSYYMNNGNLIDNGIECDVQLVQYSEENVYLHATGVPRYATSPFGDGNPSQAQNADYLFRIPRNPEVGPSGGTSTGLGHTAVLINGVPTFNALDAFSYNNQNNWHQNGGFFELAGFDCAKGHPAMGRYHHHLVPSPFSNSLDVINLVCNEYPSDGLLEISSDAHSPIIGYAFDGYPIYGPFGFANDNGSGEIVRMQTSYSLRDIAVRHTLPDGTVLAPNQYGPDVGELVTPAIPPGAQPVEAVLGAYIEDFEYIPFQGHLDVFNGRECVTPEYPQGTYAYFATVDENWNPQYPYFFSSYRGVVATDNFGMGGPGGPGGTSVTIDEDVEDYSNTASLWEQLQNPWTIYPNPAKSHISAQGLSVSTRFQIYDASGRVLEERLLAPGELWNVQRLSSGSYIIAAENGTGQGLHIVR
jgi:hypothetical protein